MNWLGHLQGRLQEMQPARICALDERAFQLASSVLPETPVHLNNEPLNTPCALALGIEALSGLNLQDAQHLISQTRLYVAPRLLLVEHMDAPFDADMFRALGFTLGASDTDENINVYEYDLDTYKPVPDWLNARFWAHPERWKP